ncbi:MAG: hypothetical protein FWB91_00100 [Defluviitaleaceae bacterium]|nr:hypothetical protein [Defluviitaleaceae bacterium]
MAKNTSVENYDHTHENEPMTQEEVLMNEDEILAGLLEMTKSDDESTYRMVEIARNGKKLLQFRVRPLSEEESQQCHRNATKYARSKPGQPKIPIETDGARYRSYMIYAATVDEDKAKVWDNPKIKQARNVLDSIDLIDLVLLAGEKARVLMLIDEISGFAEESIEMGKPSSRPEGERG